VIGSAWPRQSPPSLYRTEDRSGHQLAVFMVGAGRDRRASPVSAIDPDCRSDDEHRHEEPRVRQGHTDDSERRWDREECRGDRMALGPCVM
jgi:hypothetical protein